MRSRVLGTEGRGYEKIAVNGEKYAEVDVWCVIDGQGSE